MTYTNTQLRDWAMRAQTHMADELALYGITESDVRLPAITPAMVRSILAVVDIAPAYTTPQPVLDYVAANPPFGGTVTYAAVPETLLATPAASTPVVQPVTPQLRRVRLDGQTMEEAVPQIVARLQELAVNGEMPSRTAYDAQRGSLPASSTLFKANYKWPELADMAHLRVLTPTEVMNRERLKDIPQTSEDIAAWAESVYAAVRAMAVDGRMPSQADWDENRPAHLPPNRTVRYRLNMEWSQIAARLGLKANATRGGKAARRPRVDADAFRADVLAAMRAMAVDGRMPSQSQWNLRKPTHLPTHSLIVERLGCRWSEIADLAGLTTNPNGFGHQLAEQEADAAVYAARFRAASSLSNTARGILGPEHVVVTPHRNGTH